MGIKCGIVGLPNVGKSTLFNAVTQAQNAAAANYPVLHDRPERGRRAGAGPAAREARRDREVREDPADHGRVRGHRRARRRRVQGRGPRQQVPGAHPRDRRDRARGALLRERRHRARRRAHRSAGRHRRHQHRARARRPRHRRARAAARREGVEGRRQGCDPPARPAEAHAGAPRRRQAGAHAADGRRPSGRCCTSCT